MIPGTRNHQYPHSYGMGKRRTQKPVSKYYKKHFDFSSVNYDGLFTPISCTSTLHSKITLIEHFGKHKSVLYHWFSLFVFQHASISIGDIIIREIFYNDVSIFLQKASLNDILRQHITK
jgi:hypothetical protein